MFGPGAPLKGHHPCRPEMLIITSEQKWRQVCPLKATRSAEDKWTCLRIMGVCFRAVWVEIQGTSNAAAAQILIADLAKDLLKEHLVHMLSSGPLHC